MHRLPLLLVIAAFAGSATPAQAQGPAPIPQRQAAFASWRPPEPTEAADRASGSSGTTISRQGRRALIGGAIGAVAGLAVCTVISNLTDEGAEGFSTCTWKGYLLTGGIGFGVGFAAGWLL
jgi:hypothetical protein